jgi:glutamyl-tRNA reductase
MMERQILQRLESGGLEQARQPARDEAARIGRERRPTLHLCGINHTRAPLELLERYALSPEDSALMLGRLRDEAGADQALVLSTCNRTELYAWGDAPGLSGQLRESLHSIAERTDPVAAAPPLYEYRGVEAVRHLFAVESGLDSMILGENYIKQQVNQAWLASQEHNVAGADLNRVVQAALRCGKRIRTETALNEGTLESDIAAILKAESVLGTLAGRVCIVIGAGKIGRRAARAIAERAPARLLIVNRTLETAREIAEACRGEAHGLEDLETLLPLADFVLGAAFAPEFVVRRADYESAGRPGGRRDPVCMVDTAMPRIFDPELGRLPGVSLFDLEQMQEIVELNRGRRVAAAQQGWGIVAEEIEKFRQAQLQAELAPAIRRLGDEFDRIFLQERAALESLAGDEPSVRRLEAALRRIKQRLLHEAILELKRRISED